MSRKDNPPFPRGSTLGVSTTSDGKSIEGKIWEFEDVIMTGSSAGQLRSNSLVTCRAVRNMASAATQFTAQTGYENTLWPKRLVTYKAGTNAQVDGYATVTNHPDVVAVDEWLPTTTGIPLYDIGWVVIDGPAVVKTSTTQYVLGTGITAGNITSGLLASVTAATSGATSAGRIEPLYVGATTGAAGAFLAAYPLAKIGSALSSCTSQGYDQDVLFVVKKLS